MGYLYSVGSSVSRLSLFCWAVLMLMTCLYSAELSTEIVDYFSDWLQIVATLCTAYFKIFVLLSYHVNPRYYDLSQVIHAVDVTRW